MLLQLAFNLDYDLTQADEILDQLIQNWERVTFHVRDSRRVAAYRSHIQEVSLLVSFLIGYTAHGVYTTLGFLSAIWDR